MPEEEWSVPERWAWGEIRAGRFVDFNKRERREPALDPAKPEGWSDLRRLSSDFLREILFREPYRAAIPIKGVRIVGGWFPEEVDLAFGHLSHQLWLERCRFDKAFDGRELHVEGSLSFEGLTFLEGADLSLAKIDGTFFLRGATVAGKLDMNGLHVGQHLFMDEGARFQDVDLAGAKIDGHLDLSGTIVAGELLMFGLHVRQGLLMSMGATFHQDVNLGGAKVDGRLSMSGATLAGTLEMNSLHVGQDLSMSNATFEGWVGLIFARIGSNLDLSLTNFAYLDLSATRIEGELRLVPGPRPAPARLSLRNAHAGVLHVEATAETHAWPGVLELEGFTYDRLGGVSTIAGDATRRGMLDRDIGWYIKPEHGWLEIDPSYTSQPYVQLASIFRKAGEPEKADQVLYAGRKRARREAKGWRKFGLWLLQVTIGYGIGLRYFRALIWVLVLTGIGTAAVAYVQWQDLQAAQTPSGSTTVSQPRVAVPDGSPSNGERTEIWPARATNWSDRLLADAAYSLDELLPIVTLDRAHDKVELEGGIRFYFMLHRLVGFLLGGFILAGLGGLTQK
jgi:hypothetical protein